MTFLQNKTKQHKHRKHAGHFSANKLKPKERKCVCNTETRIEKKKCKTHSSAAAVWWKASKQKHANKQKSQERGRNAIFAQEAFVIRRARASQRASETNEKRQSKIINYYSFVLRISKQNKHTPTPTVKKITEAGKEKHTNTYKQTHTPEMRDSRIKRRRKRETITGKQNKQNKNRQREIDNGG